MILQAAPSTVAGSYALTQGSQSFPAIPLGSKLTLCDRSSTLRVSDLQVESCPVSDSCEGVETGF